MTLHELLIDMYAPLKSLTERTVELYGYTIDSYGESLGRQATVQDFDELKIMRFLTHRVRTRAAATAAKDRAQLRALWEFAARRKIVETWPTIPPVHVPERVPVCWLTDEMQRLMDSAARETVDIDGIPAAKFWRALLLLAYDSGERITPML
jgi:site-specific recombinase XerD